MNRIDSAIHKFTYEDGDIQRVQVVRFDDFHELQFMRPGYEPSSFENLCSLYRDYIVKRHSKFFGKIVIYTLDDEPIPFRNDLAEGAVDDPLAIVNLKFRRHIHWDKDGMTFDKDVVESYYKRLEAQGKLLLVKGDRDTLSFLPVGKTLGLLSQNENDAAMKTNASFFVMDLLDHGSGFDRVGVPIGLMVENGRILNPPQFGREALLVHQDGGVEVEKVYLRDLLVSIGRVKFIHGRNARFYERPKHARTPKGRMDIVVLNNRVVAINPKGGSQVPSGGFVIQPKGEKDHIGDLLGEIVAYEGLGEYIFAIQVGNSAVVDGIPTRRFISPFYNYLKFYKTSYPPSMYPLKFNKARAPRVVLGADDQGRGMLLWFEGKPKFGYVQGQHSCGASLLECAEIASSLGMANGVHMDGGGSAQILLDNHRYLECSDRDPEDLSERERAVPVGLMIRQGEVTFSE